MNPTGEKLGLRWGVEGKFGSGYGIILQEETVHVAPYAKTGFPEIVHLKPGWNISALVAVH
jgi:hypothetical protein